MSSFDRTGSEEDANFERVLLESASTDEFPADVTAAWAKLGAGLIAAGSLAAVSTRAGAIAGASARLGRWAVARWVVLGFIAGSVCTALVAVRWFRPSAPPRVVEVLAPSAVPIAAPSAAAPSAAAPGEASSGTSAPARVSERAPHKNTAHVATAPRFGLGAQVALLDSARGALAAGNAARALELTAQYEREFPSGQLAPDAEVVALEALAANDEDAELTRRARRFLARYPGDPHAGRVESLLAR